LPLACGRKQDSDDRFVYGTGAGTDTGTVSNTGTGTDSTSTGVSYTWQGSSLTGINSAAALVVSGQQIQFVKQQIDGGIEPYKSAWDRLVSDSDGDMGSSAGSPYAGTPGSGDAAFREAIYIPMTSDMNRVIRLAWRYRLTGEADFADRAEEYLKKWTQWTPNSTAAYPWWTDILVDIPYTKLMIGMDMISDSPNFTDTEKNAIGNWIYGSLLPFHIGLITSGTVTDTAKANPWGRNKPLAWGNIHSWANTLTALIAVHYDDLELLRFAVEDDDNKASGYLVNFRNGILEQGIYVEPDGMVITDWYRSSPYDPHRSPENLPECLGYPAYHTQALSILCMLMKNQGIDFFSYTTETGTHIKGLLDYLAPRLDESNPLGSENTGFDTQEMADEWGISKLLQVADFFNCPEHQFLKNRFLAHSDMSDVHIWSRTLAFTMRSINEPAENLGGISGRILSGGAPERNAGAVLFGGPDNLALPVEVLSDGTFSLNTVRPGSYIFKVFLDGNSPKEFPISVSASGIHQFGDIAF
jgi:hypothetical protein